MLFVEEEAKKIKLIYEKAEHRDFAKKYEKCKKMCIDPKFDKFYQDLVYGEKDRKPPY